MSATSRDFSEDVAATVDAEVRALMDAAHREAWEILTRNHAVLEDLASQLLEKETLLEKDLERIFAPVIKQPERPLWRADDTLVVEEAVAASDFPAAAKAFSRNGEEREGDEERNSAEGGGAGSSDGADDAEGRVVTGGDDADDGDNARGARDGDPADAGGSEGSDGAGGSEDRNESGDPAGDGGSGDPADAGGSEGTDDAGDRDDAAGDSES